MSLFSRIEDEKVLDRFESRVLEKIGKHAMNLNDKDRRHKSMQEIKRLKNTMKIFYAKKKEVRAIHLRRCIHICIQFGDTVLYCPKCKHYFTYNDGVIRHNGKELVAYEKIKIVKATGLDLDSISTIQYYYERKQLKKRIHPVENFFMKKEIKELMKKL